VFTAAGSRGQSLTFEDVTGLGTDVNDFLF
jgi:hypothetical protein